MDRLIPYLDRILPYIFPTVLISGVVFFVFLIITLTIRSSVSPKKLKSFLRDNPPEKRHKNKKQAKKKKDISSGPMSSGMSDKTESTGDACECGGLIASEKPAAAVLVTMESEKSSVSEMAEGLPRSSSDKGRRKRRGRKEKRIAKIQEAETGENILVETTEVPGTAESTVPVIAESEFPRMLDETELDVTFQMMDLTFDDFHLEESLTAPEQLGTPIGESEQKSTVLSEENNITEVFIDLEFEAQENISLQEKTLTAPDMPGTEQVPGPPAKKVLKGTISARTQRHLQELFDIPFQVTSEGWDGI